ncbi:glycosyltransferase family 2 protein [Billgrantia montanilacus]|uniref:Glycosyltransferase family 2 protein n=1 Tax=Billgrantia montanilacus TaxID=2282305 RepID=A0A368U2G4_9GAMM|nr:glycosyltransferase family 2 protein [Halomonas montanilacus]RCV91011.1 glycosyltransferase family 2 protein [Halomonas montanilacus]
MKCSLPPVSIGIPFFNAEDTLLDAVRAVFSQSHIDWELILLDDGSTDNSLELAQSIKDPRVRVYSDGKNRWLAARLNQVTALASHDFIARMDADDLISPERLRIQLEFLLARPKLDLVSTGICSLSNNNYPLGLRVPSNGYKISPKTLLSGNSGIVHASLLGKRAWFQRNPYRENIRVGEDANLWVRAFSQGDLQVGFVDKPLYYYREDGNVVPSKLAVAYRECLRTIMKDSGFGFSLADKVHAFSVTLAKLMVARGLSIAGSLDILRRRRNKAPLSQDEKDFFLEEIKHIQAIDLPV